MWRWPLKKALVPTQQLTDTERSSILQKVDDYVSAEAQQSEVYEVIGGINELVYSCNVALRNAARSADAEAKLRAGLADSNRMVQQQAVVIEGLKQKIEAAERVHERLVNRLKRQESLHADEIAAIVARGKKQRVAGRQKPCGIECQ